VSKGNQTIFFTLAGTGTVGGSTPLLGNATSGLTVAYSLDGTSGPGVCSISGTTLNFLAVGNCVVNATQAGNGSYNAAPQVQQTVVVGKSNQTIFFNLAGTGS